jgi:hypothetical protein
VAGEMRDNFEKIMGKVQKSPKQQQQYLNHQNLALMREEEEEEEAGT